jgi:hypothetical protein
MTTSDETPHEGPAGEGGASRDDETPPEDIRENGASREDTPGADRPDGGGGGRGQATFQQLAQARLIIENRRDQVNKPEGWQQNGVDVFYREHHMLVRNEYLRRVTALGTVGGLGPAEGGPAAERAEAGPPGTPPPYPTEVVGVVAGISRVRTAEPVEVALAEITSTYGVGVCAPDYLLSIAPGSYCPATEPEVVPPWADPDPGPAADHAAGEGVRVVVVDTGLDPVAPATHTWMNGVTGDPDINITPNPGNPDELGHYAGHGTFIAGIVRCIAPAAEVVVKQVFDRAGTSFESDVIKALEEVLATGHPDVISMSAGSSTLAGVGMIGLRAFVETHLVPHKGVVLIAAAGNNHVRRPFYPAASPWAVGVGALAANRRNRAGYSNFGGWVDVYTPGTDIVNAFPKGTYITTETVDPVTGAPKPETRTFEGMARWSGTSFATPVFAGMVAARMSKTGENGTAAAAALLAKAREGMIPGTGPVLLP